MKQETSIETLDEIADRIAYKYLDRTFGSAKLKSDVLSALRNEREACAKVADAMAHKANEEWKAAYKRNDSSPMKVYNGRRLASEDIAAAIRKGSPESIDSSQATHGTNSPTLTPDGTARPRIT